MAYVVVGVPEKGMVGIGRGKGDSAPTAVDQAFHQGKSRKFQSCAPYFFPTFLTCIASPL